MIGIIGAMDIETDGIKHSMTETETKNISSIEFVKGKICGKDAVCAMCNPGKVNAALCAQIMILTYNPDIIINSGVAGSLDTELDVLSVVIGEKCVQHDYDLTALGSPLGMIDGVNTVYFECNKNAVDVLGSICSSENCKTGIIATGDQFISGEKSKNRIRDNFGAIACDMEGGAIAHVCMTNDVPFAALRVISDGASEIDFNIFKTKASNKSIEILLEFVKKF